MIDIFTYSIYFGLLGTLLVLTSLGAYSSWGVQTAQVFSFQGKRNLNVFHLSALLLLSFVVGFRYNVGVDWMGYKMTFESLRSFGESFFNRSSMEIGYLTINQWVIDMGWDYTAMFFIVALFSWFFIFISVPTKLLPLTIFFLFTDEYFFWSMNGVRQFMAIAVFLYAIKFILSKNLLYYISFILFASLFHKTALLLIPLYFLPINKLYNHKVWMTLFLVSIFLSQTSIVSLIIDSIFSILANYSTASEVYARYADSRGFLSQELHYGLGYYFKTITSFFVFLMSKSIGDKYPSTRIYFLLFFIGAIFNNIFIEIPLASRFILYFSFLKPLLLAIIIYYLWNKKTYLVSVSTCVLFVVLFAVAIYKSSNLCSPFNFV